MFVTFICTYQISLGIAFIKMTLPPIKCIEIIQHMLNIIFIVEFNYVFHVTMKNLVFTPNSLLFTKPNRGKQGYFEVAAL